jgi:zinc transport system substrate-binding protein
MPPAPHRLSRRTALALLLAGALGALPGCGGKDEPATPAARGTPEVWTTFYPTTWMARRLAGPDAKVVCPLPADEDPIFWKPSDDALKGYQAADLVVVNGAEFEKWVAGTWLAEPSRRTIDTAEAFKAEWVHFEQAQTHSHGGGAAHTHEGLDGHTWLDPQLAVKQARAIHGGLVKLLPAKEKALDERLAALERDLGGLDASLKALGAQPDGTSLYASHPAYNYVAKRYGWRVVNLDLDPEAMPDDAALADLKAKLATAPGTFLLWESTPLPAIAERLAKEHGLTSLTVEPCETETDPQDADGYLTRWKQNLQQLKRALAPR